MTGVQYHQLTEFLQAFIRGTDRSKAHAAAIEGFLIEHLYEDEAFEDLIEGLARYQPGGGAFLYDEHALLPLVAAAMEEVKKRSSATG